MSKYISIKIDGVWLHNVDHEKIRGIERNIQEVIVTDRMTQEEIMDRGYKFNCMFVDEARGV